MPIATSSPDNHTVSEEARAYTTSCQDVIALAKEQLAALEGRKHPATGLLAASPVLEELNNLWIGLDRAMSTASVYRNVHPDAGVRTAADHCEQELAKISTNIGLSRPLYAAVVRLDVTNEDAATQHYVRKLLRDFKRSGIDKDDATRAKIRKLNEELVAIGQQFNANIREDVRRITLDSPQDLDGLPGDYRKSHMPEHGGIDQKITVSTDYPDYVPFMTYAKSDNKRLELYKAFRQRGYPKNKEVLQTLLSKRYELATTLGYKTWADYAIEDKMMATTNKVAEFIEKIKGLATQRAKTDYQELLTRLHRDNPNAPAVGDWQKTYFEEAVRRENYSFDSQSVREYFPYDRVKEGVLDTTSRMFGVTYKKIAASVWHPSVEVYEIWSGATLIGQFYLDMHPRENKYKHAAAFTLQAGVKGKQIPKSVLVCNFPGGDGNLGLMQHDDVETFFHEFGHLLHHIFAGNQRWIEQSGISTEWDFVEAPSQMLEEWAWDPDVLQRFARNSQNQPIPKDLVQKMRRVRDFGKGVWVMQQLFYTALSLRYYDQEPNTFDTTRVLQELQQRYSLFPYVPETFFQYSFDHLQGYSALYYTYLWSLVIAKDMFHNFSRAGLFNPGVCANYRHQVLEPGGSKPAAKLVFDFLGRQHDFRAFQIWLEGS